VRDPSVLIGNYCSYVDVYDLCDAVVRAIETDLPGHEVFYIASPDTIGGHPLEETVTTYYGSEGIEFRPPSARMPRRSPPRRRSGCWAGSPPDPGATTSTTKAELAREEPPSRQSGP
jgi:nucleoside-diphosphate-sugar epimerase